MYKWQCPVTDECTEGLYMVMAILCPSGRDYAHH